MSISLITLTDWGGWFSSPTAPPPIVTVSFRFSTSASPQTCGRRAGRGPPVSRIAAALKSDGLEPENVVNNAGFALAGPSATLDRSEQLAMIDLNVRALTELSLTFVESLVRHRGGILNVASVAAFLPGPGMAVYYASKAYVLSFSEALHGELSRRGVRVTALRPGPVSTEFQTRAGLRTGGIGGEEDFVAAGAGGWPRSATAASRAASVW